MARWPTPTPTLSRWAEERSGGRFVAGEAVTIPLARLRRPTGAADLAAAIGSAAESGRPVAVIPDAESDDDLRTIARGLRAAEDAGSPVIVRCSPAFVAALTGSAPRTAPAPSGERGVLVVCGSFVPATTAQLECLERRHPDASVPARVSALAGDGADAEIERISRAAARAHRGRPVSPWSRPSASATRRSSTPRASSASPARSRGSRSTSRRAS